MISRVWNHREKTISYRNESKRLRRVAKLGHGNIRLKNVNINV